MENIGESWSTRSIRSTSRACKPRCPTCSEPRPAPGRCRHCRSRVRTLAWWRFRWSARAFGSNSSKGTRNPIWSGCWGGSASEVPAVVLSGQPGVGQITLVTPGQHTLVISDLPGIAGGITVRTPDGARISLNDNAIALDNGKGAAISLVGNTVKIGGGEIVIATGKVLRFG